ncbi:MAG: helix-turn-helix domain-containing protein [Saccharospirillaceae bacterium]|nr:helix-turn-helix domain-containing protein [Saccharospirillaceae bacterium]
MSKEFQSIADGLQEAIDLVDGKDVESTSYKLPLIDVAKMRKSLGLTQVQFADKLRISVATLRHWERGDRTPQEPALALLNVVAKEPEAVMRALG